ncbi:hypothetical protein DS878_02080 [Marinobacter sp. F3R11]|nr:hypothetical protein DS878_02080 [Marinobacter sp. F3R11]
MTCTHCIDQTKTVFSIHGTNQYGKVVVRKADFRYFACNVFKKSLLLFIHNHFKVSYISK